MVIINMQDTIHQTFHQRGWRSLTIERSDEDEIIVSGIDHLARERVVTGKTITEILEQVTHWGIHHQESDQKIAEPV
jgi:hypothetical protein